MPLSIHKCDVIYQYLAGAQKGGITTGLLLVNMFVCFSKFEIPHHTLTFYEIFVYGDKVIQVIDMILNYMFLFGLRGNVLIEGSQIRRTFGARSRGPFI